jgi:hypothetical protein
MSSRSNYFIIFGSDDDHDLVNLYHGPVFVLYPQSSVRCPFSDFGTAVSQKQLTLFSSV